MVKKRSLPKYEVHEVTDRFEHWLRGNHNFDSPLVGARLQVDGAYDLQREDLQLQVVAGGMPQIMWFAQDLDVSKTDDPERVLRSFSFHVLSPGLDEKKIERLSGALTRQRGNFNFGELRAFDGIFGKPSYRAHVVPFQRDTYAGVCIDVPITRIPLGNQNRLSDNLFKYAESGIARPVRGFVYDLQKE